MAENELDPMIDDEVPDTPEDVAILYSWANMHGAKYRDFSASRREYRAQMRQRAMEAQREAELRAAQEREDAAREQEAVARKVAGDSSSRRAAIELEEAAMRAEVERQEAQRHAHAAELARQAAMDAEREAEEARRRSREQAARYAESEQRRRAYAGPQPHEVPGKIEDPYHYAGHVDPSRLAASGIRSSGLTRTRPGAGSSGVRPDSLPNPARLIRDDVRESAPVADLDATPGYTRDGRYEVDRPEGDSRQVVRSDNRVFRDPLDPRFQSSSAARSAYRQAPRSDDPNVVLPRHEDVREGVDREIFDRLGAQELLRRQDEEHRREDFFRSHRPGSPARPMVRPADPEIEQYTQPRPAFETRSRQRAKEDAEARFHLHEEVERELNHGRTAADELRRKQAELNREREAEAVWEAEHKEAEAKRKLERDQREQARIQSESEMRQAARAEELRQAERAESERRAREIADRDRLEAEEREARRREEEQMRAAEQQQRERTEQEAAHRAERERAERVRLDAEAAAEREDKERAEREANARKEEERLEQERLAQEREREAARRERARMDLRESLMSSSIRPAAGSTSRPVAGASSIRPAFGASAIRPASGGYSSEAGSSRPAWLHQDTPSGASTIVPAASAMNDTLQQSRERVAARWFALKELLGQSSGEHAKAEVAQQRQRDVRTPSLCVISMAGGVGRTSMVATLGRTLSAMGEKVLLADTGSHGLLPYYFGARDLRPGVVRTFSPPNGSPDAPVYMVNFNTDSANYDPAGQDHIYSELQHASRGIHRVLLDLQMPSAWLVRRLAKTTPTVLVPLAPDMNSVLGIQSIERILSGLVNTEGQLILPFYVLNQFDASQPLHLDVREALRQKLGERLLPIVIRRAPAVAEALAEGMTVMDYAPNSAVTEDYSQLAAWVRNMTAPANTTFRGMRWSEG